MGYPIVIISSLTQLSTVFSFPMGNSFPILFVWLFVFRPVFPCLFSVLSMQRFFAMFHSPYVLGFSAGWTTESRSVTPPPTSTLNFHLILQNPLIFKGFSFGWGVKTPVKYMCTVLFAYSWSLVWPQKRCLDHRAEFVILSLNIYWQTPEYAV